MLYTTCPFCLFFKHAVHQHFKLHAGLRDTIQFPRLTKDLHANPCGFITDLPDVDLAGRPHDEQSGAKSVRAKGAWFSMV